MAQDVTLLGADYSSVPSVILPKTGGGNAEFTDTTISDNAASASDIATGKKAYVNGNLVTGTYMPSFVHSEFTCNSSKGVQTVAIPYSGNGFPLMILIMVKGGAYVTGTTWFNLVQNYAIGVWAMCKTDTSYTPSYTTSGARNQGTTLCIFKNSTSSASSYTRSSTMNTNVYSGTDAQTGASTCVSFISKNQLSIYVNTNGYGFVPNLQYEYFVVYSQ